MQSVAIRRARTADVEGIQALVRPYVERRILLGKPIVMLYEDVQEFRVAETEDGRLVGCGALHVLWRDLGEIRTIATDPEFTGHGIGHRLLQELMAEARTLGLERLFCLTFETRFFERHGFRAVEEQLVDESTFQELVRSPDVGVHEFLDMPWVKPNTLGNTRMICELGASA